MKKLVLILCLVAGPGYLWAAEELAEQQSVFGAEMMKSALSQGRAEAFQSVMRGVPVTDQEKFWRLYQSYADKKGQLDSERLKLVDQYATNYLTLTDTQALKLMDRFIKLQQDDLKLRVQIFKQLSKKVSPLVATRFYQADDYLQAALKMESLGRIPFFGDRKR